MKTLKSFFLNINTLLLMLAALCMTACGNDEETYSDKDDDTAIIKVGMAAPTFGDVRVTQGKGVYPEFL